MTNLLNKVIKLTLAAMLLIAGQVAYAGVAVITHPGVTEIGLSKDKLTEIYLGKMKSFSNGTRVQAVDLPKRSEAHKKFYKVVVQMTDSEMNRYWAKLKYTGKGKPPKQLDTDEEVKSWVANNPGAVGYIDGKYLDKSVKVVLIIP